MLPCREPGREPCQPRSAGPLPGLHLLRVVERTAHLASAHKLLWSSKGGVSRTLLMAPGSRKSRKTCGNQVFGPQSDLSQGLSQLLDQEDPPRLVRLLAAEPRALPLGCGHANMYRSPTKDASPLRSRLLRVMEWTTHLTANHAGSSLSLLSIESTTNNI